MDVLVEGPIVSFSGCLNEKSDMNTVANAVKLAHQNLAGLERVVVSFEKVQHANSSGISRWLMTLSQLNLPITYVNAPVWMSEQFSQVQEFFKADVLIASLYAPYYAPSQDKNIVRLLKIGKDVPFLDNYDGIDLIFTEDGAIYEPDFEPAEFFYFLAKFRKKLERIAQ